MVKQVQDIINDNVNDNVIIKKPVKIVEGHKSGGLLWQIRRK